MITILPDKDYEKCNLIDKKYEDNVFVLTAKDGEEYLGFGAVKMGDDYAEIIDISCAPGFESLDHGIGKSLLNFIERRGVYDTLCTLENQEKLLKRLGFKEADVEWEAKTKSNEKTYHLNLKGYFEKHC